MNLRREAMLMLEKRGAVLETAQKFSRIMEKADIRGAVIGGVAVVLHGHVRTTRDVDVLVDGPLESHKASFVDAGMVFDANEREFVLDRVPVYLVTEEIAGPVPRRFTQIEGITTVRLGDLISMKLRSGMANLVRAQDIADVIGLIHAQSLGHEFARVLDRTVRAEFKKLVDAVRNE